MKKIIVILILMCVFSLHVCAQDDTYKENYEISGAETLSELLDSNTREFMEQNGIDTADSGWVNNLSVKGVFTHIVGLFKGGIKHPLISGAGILGIILVTAALMGFGTISPSFTPALYAAALAVCAIIAGNVWQSVSAAVGAVKGCSTFMLGFIPVFTAIVALSGSTVTAASMSALLLGAAELVSAAGSFAVLPLMGGYLALGISTGVSPLLNQSGIVETVKKLSMWILSFCSTVFVGVLSIQTAVNAAADSVTLRTAKFILGTSVPVAGGALSEAVSTISASVSLLRSSVGIYGVVALALIFLPCVVELLLWRVVLLLTSGAAELFSLGKISGILKAVDNMIAVLVGILLLVAGMFIISLSVVVTAGKTV